MMKKILFFMFPLLIFINATFAYNLTAKDFGLVGVLEKRIEKMLSQKSIEDREKIVRIFNSVAQKPNISTRISSFLIELSSRISQNTQNIVLSVN